MSIIACVRREGNAAVYLHADQEVICEHIKTEQPWDKITQSRIKVRVTRLGPKGQRLGRSKEYATSSYDVAALQYFGVGDVKVRHYV